ncbi:MAG TPA: M20/M25/M40 family metallo-hydrolase [Bryobacteraceae bacterium]|nr:M20/M25/M40 family metallo-hydrolase [Bryobacteraceae bacterium]
MWRLLPALAVSCALAQSLPEQQRAMALDILRELVDINTTDSSGDNTRAADAMAARLRQAGFAADDVHVLAPLARKGNLVLRYRGTGTDKPILFLAHLDVVEARREDWTSDPFHMTERDGYYYGRGIMDDKSGDADLVATLVRLKQEGFQPRRDLIVALTSDEEAGTSNGVQWLLENHRDLIDAVFCINTDAGGGVIEHGRRAFFTLSGAEKTYQSFRLEVTNPGGHSSLPVKDNAIYRLAQALLRIGHYDFPVQLNDVTREYFRRMAGIEKGALAADMKAIAEQQPPLPGPVSRLSKSAYYNALMRTTCVATMVTAGHAENALPQRATATVNCRLVPGDSAEHVLKTLHRLVGTPVVEITPVKQTGSSASPLTPLSPEILNAVESTAHSLWPEVPVIPVMDTGASDGKWTRQAGIPTYGVSAVFDDADDVRAHGKDERIGAQAYFDSVEFYYRLMKRLGE